MRAGLLVIALALASAMAGLLIPASARAMPLRPDLLERARAEGRLEEASEAVLSARISTDFTDRTEAPDSIHVLVLLVNFSDVEADTISHGRAWFRSMLFGAGQSSMSTYFAQNSYGRMKITGEVFGWFKVKETMAYYSDGKKGLGFYPRNAQKLVEEAVDAADSRVDFSAFDSDGGDGLPASGDDDGVVDFLLVVHAGPGYEWTMNQIHIHSHAGSIKPRTVDGVQVVDYATEPENGKVGTFAHELGHLLGLPDLYDLTLNSFGLGMVSLMAYGSWGGGDGSRPVGLDAWSKARLGFLEPATLDANQTGVNLQCVEDGPHALRLWSEGEEGPQYFLVENRRAKSYDSYLSQFGEGLLVYHVDERVADNSNPGKHLITLEQADGEFDLDGKRYFGFGSDAGDPFPGTAGNREFAWWTTPSNYANEGVPTQVVLSRIGDPGDVMTFGAGVETPVVLFSSLVVDDAGGDNDGEPDAGEDVAIGVRFMNHGTRCDNVRVTLSTDDPYVSITHASASQASIPGHSASGLLWFQAAIALEVPQPYNISLEADVEGDHTSGHYRFTDRFTLTVPMRQVVGWPRSTPAVVFSSPAFADLDGDGLKEIVLGCHDGRVYAWRADGSLADGWPASTGGRVTSTPAICDVDLDGRLDVIVGSQNGSAYVFDNQGRMLPGWPRPTDGPVIASPALGDVDDDGLVEIVVGSKDGRVHAWNEDGSHVPGWPVSLGVDEIWMSPALADFDGDHVPEVIVGAYGADLYVLRGDGSRLPGWPVRFGWGCGRGSPTIADFDGDGACEIAVSGLFSNSVYVIGIDGKIKRNWPRWAYNCDAVSSPVPADIDNDGLPEIAVSTSCGSIVAWNIDGSVSSAIDAETGQMIQYCEPVFVDFDGNGAVEGVVGTSADLGSALHAFGPAGPLVGFPVPVEGQVWATPAVGDIDNDGYVEIATATTAGKVYLWRFVGGKRAGRIEWARSRGNLWNTGQYGVEPRGNAPLADLVVTAADITFDPGAPKQGERVQIRVHVRNTGHAGTGEFSVHVSRDEPLDSLILTEFRMPGLAARTDTVLYFTWQVPGGMPTRLIYARLDVLDAVLESSELNNMASQRFYLSVADLEAEVTSIDPLPVSLSDSMTVRATLRNVGADTARDFVVSFYDSVASEDRRFAEFAVDSIAPGQSLDMEARCWVGRFWSDSVRVLCVADPGGRVLEYRLANNVAAATVMSGIDGEFVTLPYEVGAISVEASRTAIVVQSTYCPCVLAVGAVVPFDPIFESLGTEIDVCRNTMVFCSGGDIAGLDLASGTSYLVSAEQEDERSPAVWGTNIVWVEEGGDSVRLMLKSGLETPKAIRTLYGSEIGNPDVSSAIVVWQETGESGVDIMGYDIGEARAVPVCVDAGDQTNPAVWGSVVVWEDHSRDEGDIYGLDLRSGRQMAIAKLSGAQVDPAVQGDIVVWQDSRNGNWDIFGCSLQDMTEFPVSRQANHQIAPAVDDSTIYWVDRRHGDGRVMGLRFGSRRAVCKVNGFRALSQDALIRVVADIDEYDDGVAYKIYRFPDDRPMPPDRDKNMRESFVLDGDTAHVYADTLVAVRRRYYYTLGVVDAYGAESFFGPVAAQAFKRAPERIVVGAPYPNPFFAEIAIVLGVPRRSAHAVDESWPDPSTDTTPVDVQVFSVLGEHVATLKRERLAPGYYRFLWDGTNERRAPLAPGVYFMTIAAGDTFMSRKVVFCK